MTDESFEVKKLVAEIVPTYHIRPEDERRDNELYNEFCSLGRVSHEKPVL